MEYGLVALWLVTYLVVGFAGLPVAAVVFRRLPDRGAGVAMPLSLAVLTVVALWVGRLAFGWPALAAGLVVLGGLSVVAGRFGDADPDWRVAGETAAVFVVAFLFLVAVRAVDPAVHPLGGEKFLDFGLLKSLLRAPVLPPEDFWFAGEPVAYYYGGHLTSSLLAILTDTPARYAYNLALAGFYGMLVTGAFGVGGALADARGASRRAGGVAAVFFVGLASNLQTVGKVLLWPLPEDLTRTVASGFLTSEELAGVLAFPDRFSYWSASRVIEGTINEFPLFAWLNGDLHAHMTSTPFMLVVVALLATYFRTPESAVRRRRLLVFGAVPVVGGLLAVVNTWSFPSVMGLTALALLFAPTDPTTLLPERLGDRLRAAAGEDGAVREVARTATAVGLAVGVELVAGLWGLPFFLGPASTRQIAVFPPRSSLGGLLVVHGAFVAISAVYLASRASLDDRGRWVQAGLLVVAVLGLSAAAGAAAVGLFVPLLAGAWYLLRRRADVGFETVLLIGAVGLALAVEFVYVREQAGPGRMNTVFKTYGQVWLLWATGAGAMFVVLLSEYAGSTVRTLGGYGPTRGQAMRAFAALVVVSTAVYAPLVLTAHFGGDTGYYGQFATADDPTLDALAFVGTTHPEEADAIAWLDDRPGRPVLVTAPGGYRWEPAAGNGASAPASLTGLPTVLGWHHEIGYRGREAYDERARDVRAIYEGSPAEQAELLARYDVAYVYVGPAERSTYDVTVDELAGVTVAKEYQHVTIYAVEQSALAAGNASAA